MLSRPYQAQSSTTDRTQAAAFFGLIGLFAGVFIVAALACLYTLVVQLREQTEVLTKLQKTVEQSDDSQTVAMEALLGKEEGSPRKFVETVTKVRRERDAAREAIKDKEIFTNLAVAENKRLVSEIDKLKEENTKIAEAARKEELQNQDDQTKVSELQAELKTVFQTPAGQMSLKYSTALYAAIAGWAVAILSSLGLLALWISRTPLDDDPIPRPGSITVPIPGLTPNPPPTPLEEPPHQIV